MRNDRVFDAGYALLKEAQGQMNVWLYKGEEIVLPAGSVAEIDHKGLKQKIAHIEGVRTAQEGLQRG